MVTTPLPRTGLGTHHSYSQLIFYADIRTNYGALAYRVWRSSTHKVRAINGQSIPSERYLSLAEVEVSDTSDSNVASGKSAKQSIEHSSLYPASNAVNGKFDDFTHTPNNQGEYLPKNPQITYFRYLIIHCVHLQSPFF